MRLITDTFRYCKDNLPLWNTISISGYHIREAGSTAVQEVAFTLANAITYVQAAIDVGLDVDDFAPRLSFFFGAHNNLFEEAAKFRAARRLAGVMGWHLSNAPPGHPVRLPQRTALPIPEPKPSPWEISHVERLLLEAGDTSEE